MATRRAASLLPTALWLGTTAFAFAMTPNPRGHGTHRQLGLPPCPSVVLLDRPCPGCGLTTSWTNLVHGNVEAAFRAHALGPLLYLAFTALAVLGIRGWLTGRPPMSLTTATKATWALVGVMLAYGALRFVTTPAYATAEEREFSGKDAAQTAPDRR